MSELQRYEIVDSCTGTVVGFVEARDETEACVEALHGVGYVVEFEPKPVTKTFLITFETTKYVRAQVQVEAKDEEAARAMASDYIPNLGDEWADYGFADEVPQLVDIFMEYTDEPCTQGVAGD